MRRTRRRHLSDRAEYKTDGTRAGSVLCVLCRYFDIYICCMDGSEGLARALFYPCSSPRPEYYAQGRAEDIAWLDGEYECDE